MKHIGIIGMGNLGRSLYSMMTKTGLSVIGKVRSVDKLELLSQQFGYHVSLHDHEILTAQDAIILAVKPSQLKSVCESINHSICPHIPIISTAAVVPLSKLSQWLPRSYHIVRCMPNIPCMTGTGIVPYISDVESDIMMKRLFNPNTILKLHNDEAIDIATIISGCGPAFMAWFVQCLTSINNGSMSAEDAHLLISQTLKGTSSLLDIKTPHEIITAVASPKGVTEAALQQLDEDRVSDIIHQTLKSSFTRIQEINKLI